MGRKKRQVKHVTLHDEHRGRYRVFMLQCLLFMAIASTIGGSVWLWKILHSQQFLPIREVKIEGDPTHLDKATLIAQVTPALSGGFFAIDMQQIVDVALAQPWVERVRVRRIWPATVCLKIIEHQPVARWGKKQLLAANGSLFTPNSIIEFATLPQLDAPDVLAKTLWSEYQKLTALLLPLQLQITHLTVTDRRSWSIELNNGMHITLGNEDIMVRLGRFVTTYPHIADHRRMDNTTVDLRYTNGFAFKPA